jgi:adenine C2-methylase RlmN of 23S rRNA A2503 and tRNA A37
VTLEKLTHLLAGEPAFRVKQAAKAIFRDGAADFGSITTLPAILRQRLEKQPLLSFKVETIQVSSDGDCHKAAAKLPDGRRIETVLMSPKPGLWTTCISSQVGCALKCSFCATGLMGFTRDLTAEEITDQVLFWRQYMAAGNAPGTLSNVVYMGMGEPFLNLEAVFESLRTLTDPERFAMGDRHISVSTAGIAPGIDKFAVLFPQVNLALSLHSAVPETRRKLVPVDKAYPLERLQDSLRAYFKRNKRKVFIEYVMLDGENDKETDAEALSEFLKKSGPPQLLHVNLILFNPTDTPHKASKPDTARKFSNTLKRLGVPVTFRKNLGQDIAGACGQLVLKEGAAKP